MLCQACGNPKDDSEEYEMPADPATVSSVTDPKLLQMAEAGENWRCTYCGSAQRALDGGCARCGAGRIAATEVPATPAAPAAPPAPPRGPRVARFIPVTLVALGALGLVAGFVAHRSSPRRIAATPTATPTPPLLRTEFTAEVTASSWKRTVRIERWQLAPHESFTSDVPSGAVEVRTAGQRVHHTEEVYDHDETVYDSVEVPDGYRTESYSDRVACGENCTTSTRSCRNVCTGSKRTCKQVCKNNKNGFASCSEVCSGSGETCREECSGGDRRCTTKYCDQTKTRQVPKTRTERRPRIVRKFRSEPRYAPWSTFKAWEWVTQTRVEDSGDDATPRWPDAGVPARDGGLEVEARPGALRAVRNETFRITIKTDDGLSHPYTPSSETEFSRLGPKATVKVRVVDGVVTLL